MKHTLTAILLIINSVLIYPQVILTIEGEVINDPETNISNGYIIPRSQPTKLTFRNNSLTYVNSSGYMLQADEAPGLNNNNLDGEIITGNMLIWNGTNEQSWTHAMFTGYNLDAVIKYNYLKNTPNGIQRKSNSMTDLIGVIAYNIINNPKVGIVVKGMNGVRIYNNTLYCERTPSQTGRGLIDIHTNTDGGLNAVSTGTKICNNIFYTKYETFCINVMDQESLVGFESDYNIFYCETGSLRFNAGGTERTFEQWQALGYDLHSVVIDPVFSNFNDFVPSERLDFGKNLGNDFIEGLAIDAVWSNANPSTAFQNGIWQVGARIYDANDGDGLSIFPVPARGLLNIRITDTDLTYKKVKLYDSTGRFLITEKIEFGNNEIPIPWEFSSGLYTIVLEGDNMEPYEDKIIIIN